MSNKKTVFLTLPFTLLASAASAGGMEKTALSTAFMFEDGNYAEIGYQSSDYDVSSSSGGNASVVGDFKTTNFALKFNIDEHLSFGITKYRQSAIDMDYPNNWVSSDTVNLGAGAIPVANALPTADLKVDAIVALLKAQVDENFSVTGGLKRSTVQDATLKIPFTGTDLTVTGDSETSLIYGMTYERSEIALRAELIMEEQVGFSLQPGGTALGGAATGTKASLPNYTTLKLQSGIAPDTLAFFSARKADWASHQVILSNAATTAPISSFTDTTSYSLGLGRKLTDSLSASLAYNWEKGSGPNSASSLSLSNGYRGISAGLKYTADNVSISGGVNYTKLGDTVVTQNAVLDPVNNPTVVTTLIDGAPFSGNTVTTVGLKIGYHF